MIFITGATGILGRRVLLDLLLKGRKIIASKRPNSDLNDVFNTFKDEGHAKLFSLIQWIDIDFTDINSIQECLKGVSEIYYCMGKVSFISKDDNEIMKTNVDFLINTLYAIQGFPIKKFCYYSTVNVLNTVNHLGKIDEDSVWDNNRTHSTYTISKYLAEMEVWRASAEGLNVVVLNLGVLLATGRWRNSINVIYHWFEKSRFMIKGKSAFVDVRDVSKISIELMEKEKYNQRYILVSDEYYYNDISSKIKSKIGQNAPTILPTFLVQAFYTFSKLFSWRFEVLKIVNKNSINLLFYNPPISNEKIIKELDCKFLPIEESVEHHCNNYLKFRNYFYN